MDPVSLENEPLSLASIDPSSGEKSRSIDIDIGNPLEGRGKLAIYI